MSPQGASLLSRFPSCARILDKVLLSRAQVFALLYAIGARVGHASISLTTILNASVRKSTRQPAAHPNQAGILPHAPPGNRTYQHSLVSAARRMHHHPFSYGSVASIHVKQAYQRWFRPRPFVLADSFQLLQDSLHNPVVRKRRNRRGSPGHVAAALLYRSHHDRWHVVSGRVWKRKQKRDATRRVEQGAEALKSDGERWLKLLLELRRTT